MVVYISIKANKITEFMYSPFTTSSADCTFSALRETQGGRFLSRIVSTHLYYHFSTKMLAVLLLLIGIFLDKFLGQNCTLMMTSWKEWLENLVWMIRQKLGLLLTTVILSNLNLIPLSTE